ncbi:MAG: exosortase F system-associated membrane protein [Flavobacterium sp.]
MQKKNSVNIVSAFAIAMLLMLLAAVRFYQETLFYDPLVPFFKTDSVILPFLDMPKLLGGLTLRYAINTLLSLAILWFCFKDKSIIRLTSLLYVVFFVVLIIAFIIIINAEKPNLLALFYIRRFLIQPLFLILFIPAFYYQGRYAKSE